MGIHSAWVEKWRERLDAGEVDEDCVQEWFENMSVEIQTEDGEGLGEDEAKYIGMIGSAVATRVYGWSLASVQRLEEEGVTTVPMVVVLGESELMGTQIHTLQFEPDMLAKMVADEMGILMRIGELTRDE